MAVGCATPPPEAPVELGALGLYLFEHFEDEDPAEISAGWRNLAAFLDAQSSEATGDRAVSMPILDGAALGGLSIPEGADAANQVPVAIWGPSAFPVGDHPVAIVDPVQTCLEADITVWAGRTFQTDADCFVSGACDRLETETETRRELGIFLNVWYDQPKIYRRFAVEDEERGPFEVIAGRAWIGERFEGDRGGTAMEQLFHLDVIVEQGDAALRWFALWSSIEGGLVGDDLYANLLTSGLEEALQFNEEYLATGEVTSCPHDRSAPRPPR